MYCLAIALLALHTKVELYTTIQGCRTPGGRGALAPQFLAKQVTLSKLGGQIMPTTVLRAPPGFSDLATALQHSNTMNQ